MLPGIQQPLVRFSGVYRTTSGKLGFFFNTNGQPNRLNVDLFDPKGKKLTSIEMKPKGPHYWVTGDEAAIPKLPALYHQFVPIGPDGKAGPPLLEPNFFTKVLELQKTEGTKTITEQVPFNVVMQDEANAPVQGETMACIFPDSLTTPERREELLDRYRRGDEYSFMRNHFNRYVEKPEHSGLLQNLPRLQKSNFSLAMYQPLTGGDMLSSHGYWTTNPYLLGYRYFGTKEALRTFLKESLHQGVMPVFDGAVVNQGLNGAQFQSNLYHGVNSPYWDWFTFPKEHPYIALEKLGVGILPTKLDPETGLPVPNYDRAAYRILNDPNAPNYNPHEPIRVKFYDPKVYDENGNLLAPEKMKELTTFHFEDSIQPLEFYIHEPDLRQKRRLENKIENPLEQKRLFLDWPTFRIVPNVEDNCGLKWDGQADVAKLNMKNPDVRAYAIGSFEYWTRFVHNTFAKSLAEQLLAQKKQHPNATPTQWIQALEGKSIPAPRDAQQALSETDVQHAMAAGQKVVEGPPEQALVEKIRTQYPLYSLPFPPLFTAILTHPKLNALLKEGDLPLLLRGVHWVMTPLVAPLRSIRFFDNLFNKIAGMVRPQSFDELLAQKLAEALQPFPKSLSYENVQSLVADKLAQTVYLSLLTHQTHESPQAIETALYNNKELSLVLKADPQTGIKLLNRYLRKQLKKLDPDVLATVLKQEMAQLDPQLIGLSEALMRKRHFGLNWRIDAAKDVGDMDWLRDAKKGYEWETEKGKSNPELDRRFQKEFPFVKNFWKETSQKIRTINPNAIIIGEITNFDKEANVVTEDLGREAYQQFFEENIFTSAPVWELFGNMMQLMYSDPRPDEFGFFQSDVGNFLNTLKDTNSKVPFRNVLQNQILTSTHDFHTTADKILRNNILMTTDWLRWGRTEIDLRTVMQELMTKPLYEPQRQLLASKGISKEQLSQALEKMRGLIHDEDIQKQLSLEVQGKLTENTINNGIAAEQHEIKRNIYQTSLDAKQGLIREFFSIVKPEQLGLQTPQAMAALRDILYTMISEPSEARAMKAVLMNTFHTLRWNELAQSLGVSDPQALRAQLEPPLKEYLYGTPGQPGAFAKAIQTYGRHFGYQSLDIATDHLFKFFPPNWDKGLLGNLPPGAVENAVKEQMYRQAIEPVLEVLKRLMALQVAVPGIPSIYFHDLLAQTGGCRLKNYFVQNRQLLRDDWLDTKPYLKKFYNDVSDTMALRQQFSALNNGVVLEVTPPDAGVVPIIRDNGEQQVMMLIGTGRPFNPDSIEDWNEKAGNGETYKTVYPQTPQVHNFQLDLSASRIPVGTQYVDPFNGEAFIVNTAHKLVKAKQPSEGIDIVTKPYRLLVRK